MHGARVEVVSNERPPSKCHCGSSLLFSNPTQSGEVGGLVSLFVRDQHLDVAQISIFSVGCRLSFFPTSLGADNLGPRKFVLGVFWQGYLSLLWRDLCLWRPSNSRRITQTAVQITSTVGRCFDPPQELDQGSVLFSGYEAHQWVLPEPQPQWTEHIPACLQILYGDLVVHA